MSRHRRRFRHIFAIPVLIGGASFLGLFLGLTGDGFRDVLAWLLVGMAPFTIAAVLLRPTPR